MWGGGVEVQVTSVESRGQPDAGWLAATVPTLYSHILTFLSHFDDLCMGEVEHVDSIDSEEDVAHTEARARGRGIGLCTHILCILHILIYKQRPELEARVLGSVHIFSIFFIYPYVHRGHS